MAKHNSPLRLDASLVDSAIATGKLMHRSASEQIEQWASLGREISNRLSPSQLIDFYAGLKAVSVVDIPEVQPIDPMDVLETIDSTEFKASVTTDVKSIHSTLYQASERHPGYLEQVKDNQIVVGHFQNGQFLRAEGL